MNAGNAADCIRSDKAGYADQELGCIIKNQDHPVCSPARTKQQAPENEGITDIKQRAAQGNELSLQRMGGKASDGAGSSDRKDKSINRKRRHPLPDGFSPAPEKKGNNPKKTYSGNKMNS